MLVPWLGLQDLQVNGLQQQQHSSMPRAEQQHYSH
jgi:hypothetical protein